MGPTLNILGRKQTVVGVIVEDDSGVRNTLLDDKKFKYADENGKIDLSQVFDKEGLKEILKVLNAHLEESEQYLQELKNKIAENAINNNGVPFPFEENSLQSLVEEYKNHIIYIEGIAASIEIVKGLECEVSSTE